MKQKIFNELAYSHFRRPEHPIRAGPDLARDHHKLRHVEAALAAISLRDERLRPARQRSLRHAGGLAGANQQFQRPIIEIRKQQAQGEAASVKLAGH